MDTEAADRPDTTDGVTTFDDARAAVRSGAAPDEAAVALVATMTDDEKLWCLDGDQPTHAGLRFLARESGYHRAPFPAAEVERVGLPGIAFADGPRGCVVGNATAFPVSMARGATWDPDLEERVGRVDRHRAPGGRATLTGRACA